MSEPNDDEYEVPLRDQRYFGAGIKRKRIQFVQSTSETSNITAGIKPEPSTSAADKYLSIVLKKAIQSQDGNKDSATVSSNEFWRGGDRPKVLESDPPTDSPEPSTHGEVLICEICDRPIHSSAPHAHESSIAHQVRLQHSHPPSHLDRSRKGLAVMQTQGWDPDARRGLGLGGEGVLHPVKATSNPDRRGLGAEFAKPVATKEKTPRLDAGKARLLDAANKKKAQSLRNAFYRSEEVEKYLGEQEDAGAGSHIEVEEFQ